VISAPRSHAELVLHRRARAELARSRRAPGPLARFLRSAALAVVVSILSVAMLGALTGAILAAAHGNFGY